MTYGPHLVPAAFKDILAPDAPRLVRVAAQFWGLNEIKGPKHEPVLMDMARKLGIHLDQPLGYTADEIPWCGLFMGYVAMSAGWDVPKTPLWAQSWAQWGVEVELDDASLGDVLVWQRKNSAGKIVGGHVGPYLGEVPGQGFVCIGGNQGDTVQPAVYTKNTEWARGASARLMAVRRPPYRIKRPLTARPVSRKLSDVRQGASMV